MVQLATTSAVPLRECMARLHRHSRQTLSKKKISNQIIMHILKETENEPRRGNGSLAKGVQRWYTISGRSEQVNCVIATSEGAVEGRSYLLSRIRSPETQLFASAPFHSLQQISNDPKSCTSVFQRVRRYIIQFFIFFLFCKTFKLILIEPSANQKQCFSV